MTEALLEGGRKIGKVLEVGTGCGYQTAVLAPLVKKIYSIERIAPLAKRAKATLKELGIKNVMLKHGDGIRGLEVAEALRRHPRRGRAARGAGGAVRAARQSRAGSSCRSGRKAQQQLIRFTRRDDQIEREVLGPVAFVPHARRHRLKLRCAAEFE